MAASWLFPVRIVQHILALGVVGLTAFVIASLQSGWAFSNAIDYMLFVSCWSAFIIVPYLEGAPVLSARIAHEYVVPVVEILTSLIWLTGFVSLAALIPSPGMCQYVSCHVIQAIIVIGAVEWTLFVITNVVAIKELRDSKNITRAKEEINSEPDMHQAA